MDCTICNSRLYSPFPRVLHCRNCGVTYFDENEINRITLKQAQLLSKDSKKNESNLENVQCPVDHYLFTHVQEESIPHYIQIYKCYNCKRLLISSKNLIAFKKAQLAKISFFKNWQLPLPSLQAVLVFSLIGIISLTAVSSFSAFMQQNSVKTNASQLYSNLSIKKYNGKNAIIFSTYQPFITRITFYNKYKDISLYSYSIDTVKSRTHYLLIDEPSPSSSVFFKIEFVNEKNTVESDFIPYEISE